LHSVQASVIATLTPVAISSLRKELSRAGATLEGADSGL